MTAGVHHPVAGGFEGDVDLFVDGQGVHVSADADGGAAPRPDLGDHARATHAGFDVGQADLGQGVGNQPGGAHLLEAQFGVLVNVAAQAHHLGLQRLGSF